MRQLGNLLARLGGANIAVLDQVPEERSRFIQMGLVLLSTAGLATLSMTYALIDGLRATMAVALSLGIVWGLIILNLDRLLILNIKATGSKLRLLLMVAPRLLIAMLLGLVIATPLTLRIFQSEIAARMILDNAEQAVQQAGVRKQDPRQAELDVVNADIKRYETVLAGQMEFSSPNLEQAKTELAEAEKNLAAKEEAYFKANLEWRCERFGELCPGTGSSGKPGDGPRAKVAKEKLDAAQAARDEAQRLAQGKRDALTQAQDQNKADNATKLQQAQAEANAQLPTKRAKRAELEKALSDVTAGDSSILGGNTGLLARIEAMNRLGSESSSARFSHLAVALLLFMIELLPVLVKTLSVIGPQTPYDKVTDLAEKSRLEVAAQKRSDERRRLSRGWDKEEAIEADMVAREIKLGKHANEHVEREMTKILDVALQNWSAQVGRTLAQGAPPPPQLPQGPPGQQSQSQGGNNGVPRHRKPGGASGILDKLNLPPWKKKP